MEPNLNNNGKVKELPFVEASVDLQGIIDESKKDILEQTQVPIKKKRGRPAGATSRPAPSMTGAGTVSGAAPSVEPTGAPGPMVPILADGHKFVFGAIGKSMGIKDYKLGDDKAQFLGAQCDLVLHYYLPDMDKDPKKQILWSYATSLVMVGGSMFVEASDLKAKARAEQRANNKEEAKGETDAQNQYQQPIGPRVSVEHFRP